MIQVTLRQPVALEEVDDEILAVGGCNLGFIMAGMSPYVLEVAPGMEMANHGVQADDVLVRIDGRDTSSLAMADAVKLLKSASRLDFQRPARDAEMEPAANGEGASRAVEEPLRAAVAMATASTAPAGSFAMAADSAAACKAAPSQMNIVLENPAGAPPSAEAMNAVGLSKAGMLSAPTLSKIGSTVPPVQAGIVMPPGAGGSNGSMSKASQPQVVPSPLVPFPLVRGPIAAQGPQVVVPRGPCGVPPPFMKAGPAPVGVPLGMGVKGGKPGGKAGGKGKQMLPPKVIPPRTDAAVAPGRDPNDLREALPPEQDAEAWLELLRDGYMSQVRWQNSCPEPPPFHRALGCAAAPGEAVGEGKYPRDALNLQLQLLIGARTSNGSELGPRPPLAAMPPGAAVGVAPPRPFA